MNSSKLQKDSWERVDGEIDKEEETEKLRKCATCFIHAIRHVHYVPTQSHYKPDCADWKARVADGVKGKITTTTKMF